MEKGCDTQIMLSLTNSFLEDIMLSEGSVRNSLICQLENILLIFKVVSGEGVTQSWKLKELSV